MELEIEDYPEFTGGVKDPCERWVRKNSSRIPIKLGRWDGRPLDY